MIWWVVVDRWHSLLPATVFLEVPDNASANEVIVLVTLARINIELRGTRPEVSEFSPHAEALIDPYVQPYAGL